MSWFVRSWAPGDVHRGVFNQGMVQAACGLVFFPLRIEGQVCCHRLPQAEQVYPKCMVWADDQVAIPAVCSRHTSNGCAFTVTIDPLFNTLGEWLLSGTDQMP